MNVKEMSKKEFKKYINENGFFVNFNADRIDKDQVAEIKEDGITISNGIPEGNNIMVFKGLASQNYVKGEKSRNGYKIDQKGRMFENYAKNPVVLLQHNHEYGGIGYVNKLWLNKDGDLNILFYVDTNTLEGKTKYQVENGFITAVSTSHITHEDMIEDNKTGDRMTREEASSKLGWNELWEVMLGVNNDYTLVVTKAEMIENSLVTIGSNEGAIVTHNSVNNYFSNKYSDTLFSGILSNKLNGMTIEEVKALLSEAGLSKDQKNKLEAKLNELEKEVKEEDVKKEKEEEKKEAKEDEKKEDEKKEDEKSDGDEESDDSGNEEKKSEDSDNGEKPEGEKPFVSNNVFEKHKDSISEKFDSLNKIVEAQKNDLEDQAEAIDLLKDGMAIAIDTVNTLQNQLKNIVVDGVSSYSKIEKEEKVGTRLTNILSDLKG